MSKRGLKGKDLITIGIFAAIYFVLSLACNMLGGLSAIIWFLSPAFAAILCATPYLILCAKIKKPFAVLIMNLVVALIFLATGQFHILLPIAFLVTGIIAEGLRAIGRYKHPFLDTFSYIWVALSMIGSPIPLWIDTDNFIQKIKEFGITQSYLDTITRLTSLNMLYVIFGATIVGAVVGIILARRLFNKHFIKAGKI